ncbi:MAG: hypothetical protein JWL86_2762, partial [Rhizobium sp.]|nr:hypothetical protein [Rhizobium sp.]
MQLKGKTMPAYPLRLAFAALVVAAV